jgi:hypothetical protein
VWRLRSLFLGTGYDTRPSTVLGGTVPGSVPEEVA